MQAQPGLTVPDNAVLFPPLVWPVAGVPANSAPTGLTSSGPLLLPLTPPPPAKLKDHFCLMLSMAHWEAGPFVYPTFSTVSPLSLQRRGHCTELGRRRVESKTGQGKRGNHRTSSQTPDTPPMPRVCFRSHARRHETGGLQSKP